MFKFLTPFEQHLLKQLAEAKISNEAIKIRAEETEDVLLEVLELTCADEETPIAARLYHRKIQDGKMTIEDAPIRVREAIQTLEAEEREINGEELPPIEIEKPGKGKS